MVDPIEAYTRKIRYITYGAVLGAFAGPSTGYFLAEYCYDYPTVMQVALDVAVVIMGIPVGIGVGGLCGLILGELANAGHSFRDK